MLCDHCGHEEIFYYGCRDRHCPQCQYGASQRWAENQQQNTLPVDYHHLIITVDHSLNPWIQLHPEVIYRLLFQSAWGTLKAFAKDPKRLGGQLGAIMMLHTWGQTLWQHVHLHCLIPSGVLTSEGEWKPAKSTYLFPVRALSRHFRGTMVSKLREAYQDGELALVTDEAEPGHTLDQLMSKAWVIYNKPCINHTQNVVAYLARYSHRTAISNNRILNMDDDQIRFSYKDYHDNKHKEMDLDADEFIRRYLLHVLPKGLQRIHHCGFLANCCRKQKLVQIRKAIAEQQAQSLEAEEAVSSKPEDAIYVCPKCKIGRFFRIAELPPKHLDSS